MSVYESGPSSMIGFVLGSRDFSDLVRRLEFAMHVFHADDVHIRGVAFRAPAHLPVVFDVPG